LGGKLLYAGNNPGAVFHIILPRVPVSDTNTAKNFAAE